MQKITAVPIRNPDVLARRVDDEAVLVMPQKGQVKVLNEVGAAIWELIDGKRSIEQIVEEVCSQFAVNQATAEADTLKFMMELINRGIVSFPSI